MEDIVVPGNSRKSDSNSQHLRLQVSGLSMGPFVLDGDVVIVELTDGAKMRRGDVVVCYVPGLGAVAHRVIKIFQREGRHYFLLKGDAAHSFDKPVRADQVLGRVVAIERTGHMIRVNNAVNRHLALAYARIRSYWHRTALITEKAMRVACKWLLRRRRHD